MVNIAKLKEALRKAGVDQRELAGVLSVSDAQISRLLSGRRRMRLETLLQILALLNAKSGKTLRVEDVVRLKKAS